MGFFRTEKTESEYEAEASKYLLDGEKIIKASKNWNGWVCITDKRLMYVDIDRDSSIKTVDKFTTIPLSAIIEIRWSVADTLGFLDISTSKRTHELKVGAKSVKIFADTLMNQIL